MGSRRPRADTAPYNKITSNMKQAKLLFLLIAALTFAYADATSLRIQGYYVKDPDGWINY